MHKPGRYNDVVDALSQKVVEEFVAALTVVETDFLDRIREVAKSDSTYAKLVEQVKIGETNKYWLEDGLLFASGQRAYVPTGALKRVLMKETHDPL